MTSALCNGGNYAAGWTKALPELRIADVSFAHCSS
jgi:hypothetical protein